MMDISTLGSCIAIVMICYIVGMGCKASKRISDEWIPVIMAVIGGILGAVGMGVSGNGLHHGSSGRYVQWSGGNRREPVIQTEQESVVEWADEVLRAV